VLATYNRMLEARITQKATFLSMPPDRLLSKAEPNPREQCNYVTMKEEGELIDSEEVPMEEGREITMTSSKKGNKDGKTTTSTESDIVEILTIFPPKFPDLGSFSIPCIIGKVEIERC